MLLLLHSALLLHTHRLHDPARTLPVVPASPFTARPHHCSPTLHTCSSRFLSSSPDMSRRSAAPAQEESIYNLIPQASTAASRPSLYRSRFPHDTPPTGSTFGRSPATAHVTTNLAGEFSAKPGTHRHKQAGASFGPKNAHYSDPTSFQPANAQPELPQRQCTTREKHREN